MNWQKEFYLCLIINGLWWMEVKKKKKTFEMSNCWHNKLEPKCHNCLLCLARWKRTHQQDLFTAEYCWPSRFKNWQLTKQWWGLWLQTVWMCSPSRALQDSKIPDVLYSNGLIYWFIHNSPRFLKIIEYESVYNDLFTVLQAQKARHCQINVFYDIKGKVSGREMSV